MNGKPANATGAVSSDLDDAATIGAEIPVKDDRRWSAEIEVGSEPTELMMGLRIQPKKKSPAPQP